MERKNGVGENENQECQISEVEQFQVKSSVRFGHEDECEEFLSNPKLWTSFGEFRCISKFGRWKVGTVMFVSISMKEESRGFIYYFLSPNLPVSYIEPVV